MPFLVLMSVCVLHFAIPFIFNDMVFFMQGNHTEVLILQLSLDTTKLFEALKRKLI